MGVKDLPPQPFGDTSDALSTLKDAEGMLGLCVRCGRFKEHVGIRLGCAALGMICGDCWKAIGSPEAKPDGTLLGQAGGPLDL